MLALSGGVYLGWALGANDAANCFGTAVGSGVISFRRASVLCALAVLAGAALQGQAGIHTLSGLTEQTMTTLIIVSVSAAITITIMTMFGLPISTSQAVVGAISGIGIATHNLSTSGLAKVVISWIATPFGSMFFAVLFFTVLRSVSRHVRMGILTRDKLLWTGLVVVGIYGSYALGANNVANATGIYSGVIPGLNDFHLAVIGGGAIGLGVITFSRRVMESVGKRLMRLDAFTAFIAVSFNGCDGSHFRRHRSTGEYQPGPNRRDTRRRDSAGITKPQGSHVAQLQYRVDLHTAHIVCPLCGSIRDLGRGIGECVHIRRRALSVSRYYTTRSATELPAHVDVFHARVAQQLLE